MVAIAGSSEALSKSHMARISIFLGDLCKVCARNNEHVIEGRAVDISLKFWSSYVSQ